MSSAAVCRSLWTEIKLIVLYCLALEGMLTICKILHCTTRMNTKPKFSTCFFIAIVSSLSFGFMLVNIMRVQHFITSQNHSSKHRQHHIDQTTKLDLTLLMSDLSNNDHGHSEVVTTAQCRKKLYTDSTMS